MPFDDKYFSSHAYTDISFSKYSQYWWSNRFYAILARRYGKPGMHLLEIGSGLGHLVGQLEREFRTFAVDVNKWALDKAKEVAPHTALQLASSEALPYPANSFDLVIIKHVIEHLVHPENAIMEISRITSPRGVMIFSTPNLASWLRPLKGAKWVGFQDPTHISIKPPDEWLGILRKAGFSLIRIFSDGFWDVPYIPIMPVFLQKLIFGFLGGVQAVIGLPFLPTRWGESIIVIARNSHLEG